MKARVRLFARLSELAGTRETEVELGEGLSAGDAYRLLCARYPALADYSHSVMYAVNAEYVPAEHPLADGDELALIPPVSGGAGTRPEPVEEPALSLSKGLFEVTDRPLDPQRLVEHVRKDESGAVALFYGVVRNNSRGRRVEYLEYDAYPEMAQRVMERIAREAMARWPLTGVAMQHRTGRLEIGETSLLIAVSAPHRKEAFEACHALVDRFKEVVPIWKKEVWEGGEVWIEGEAPEHSPGD
ncbi:MAG TPA: molybdopterin converting factor subunit 1 [Dehalococcoidia bacterium]|nr:molybdopterin converting factor subunit 1 [Dehalococcoidia bacterium]